MSSLRRSSCPSLFHSNPPVSHAYHMIEIGQCVIKRSVLDPGYSTYRSILKFLFVSFNKIGNIEAGKRYQQTKLKQHRNACYNC